MYLPSPKNCKSCSTCTGFHCSFNL